MGPSLVDWIEMDRCMFLELAVKIAHKLTELVRGHQEYQCGLA